MTSKVKVVSMGLLISLILVGVINWLSLRHIISSTRHKCHKSSRRSHWSNGVNASSEDVPETRMQTVARIDNGSSLSERDLMYSLRGALDSSLSVASMGEGGREVGKQRSQLSRCKNGSDRIREGTMKDDPVNYQWSNVTNPINPHNFKLVIDQPQLCKSKQLPDPVFLLLLVLSAPYNFKQRQIQRQSCLSVRKAYGRNIRYLFLLGVSEMDFVTEAVREEAQLYNDIIMEDFHDSYRNLTLKTLMGMKWASIHCSQAVYVMKMDDNVYISLRNIVRYLWMNPRRSFFTGHLYEGTKPLRNKTSKWFVSEEEYPRDVFPPYCCGIGYILSGDLASRIFTVSLSIPYIFLEDVFVGLCLEKLGVRIFPSPGFLYIEEDYDYCLFKKSYAVHIKKPLEIGQYWLEQRENPAKIEC